MSLRVADYLTFSNLALGFVSIMLVLDGQTEIVPYLLLAAVLFDFFDGKVARMTRPTRFGAEIDSLADLVSFCVAPAILSGSYFGILLVLGGAFRLARFNTENKKDFSGLPVTVNGVALPLLYIIGVSEYIMIAYLLIASALMVSKVKIKKL